jgi:hypothetical protein
MTADPVPTDAKAPTRRRGKAWLAATAVCALAAAVGGLALRDRHNGSDAATLPPASASPSVNPSPVVTGLPGILAGNRRTLIHLANVDRDLALNQNEPAEAGGGTTPESVFLLIPLGGDNYQIKSMVPDLDGADRCIGVKPNRTASSSLVPVGCKRSGKNVFHLFANDEFDEKNRPTYGLSHETYGLAQFSEDDNRIYLEQAGDYPATMDFSFVDRGPAPA